MEESMRRVTLLAGLVLSALPAHAQETVDLRVMSFNVWYGGVQVRQPEVVEILRQSGADIIGLQEPDGQTDTLAAAGYPCVDLRRHIISRVPLFDPRLGERTDTGPSVYPLAGLDADAPHVWAMVSPGKVVAVGNLHLASDPYGPDLLRDGSSVDEVLQGETDTRLAEIAPYAAALEPVIRAGPVRVNWTGAPGLKFDWIGVHAAGDPNLYNYLAFAYTGAVVDGTMTLTPDLYNQVLAPGDYELRLMSDDHYVTLAKVGFSVTE
jgi:hypothetical protein